MKQCQSHYGLRKWLAGHRWGETGLNDPNTKDINSEYLLNHVNKDYADLISADYVSGVEHIEQQLLTQPDAMTNDNRYYIYVVPV